jgi:SAM-dependent methyltransferase
VTTDNAAAWDKYSAAYQAAVRLPTDVAHYGPDIASESELRLLGHLRGKRVLELGCGGAQCSIAFAKQGAHAIGVDASGEQLAFARRLCEREGVRVELHQGDVADLAFLRANSIDLAFSSGTFEFVEDLGRVFRQVHRVLRRGAPFVFSLPHPAWHLVDADDAGQPLVVRRSYFDRSPILHTIEGIEFTVWSHTIGAVFAGLTRANFRVDNLLEPEPLASAPRSALWRDAFRFVPRTLVVRARKEGS